MKQQFAFVGTAQRLAAYPAGIVFDIQFLFAVVRALDVHEMRPVCVRAPNHVIVMPESLQTNEALLRLAAQVLVKSLPLRGFRCYAAFQRPYFLPQLQTQNAFEHDG